MVHRIQNRNTGYSDFSHVSVPSSFNFNSNISNTAVDGANALKLDSEIISEINQDADSSNTSEETTTETQNVVLENEKLQRIKNFILDKFENFVINHLQIENQFYLTQSWTAVNHKGNAHHLHLHPNTVFSCVFYAQANSGDFQIKMPMSRIQEGYNFSYKVLQQNIFNSRTYNASVKTGDIIIFPGWLEHQALPNEDDAPRIIIGTNYFIKGSLGDYDSKDLITI